MFSFFSVFTSELYLYWKRYDMVEEGRLALKNVPRIVVLDGNIGAGKTTFLTALKTMVDTPIIMEPVQDMMLRALLLIAHRISLIYFTRRVVPLLPVLLIYSVFFIYSLYCSFTPSITHLLLVLLIHSRRYSKYYYLLHVFFIYSLFLLIYSEYYSFTPIVFHLLPVLLIYSEYFSFTPSITHLLLVLLIYSEYYSFAPGIAHSIKALL